MNHEEMIMRVNPMAFTKTSKEDARELRKRCKEISLVLVRRYKDGSGRITFKELEDMLSLQRDDRRHHGYLRTIRVKLKKHGLDLKLFLAREFYSIVDVASLKRKDRPKRSVDKPKKEITRSHLDGKFGTLRLLDGKVFFVEAETMNLFSLN